MEIIKKLFSLKNRNIIVAGGAGQIGFSFVEILLDSGANVILADLDIELAEEKVLKKFNDINKVQIVKLDVSQSSSIKDFTTLIKPKQIHGLVNCFHFKGNSRFLDTKSKFFSDFEKYSENSWDQVHNVNLKGSFLISQALLPKMKDCNASIVNISSTYGIVSPKKSIYGNSGINSPVAYATSKGGIINLTKYMATHLAEFNIRVNCLCPGGVYNNQSEEFIQNYCSETPLNRMAYPEDYQGSIVFLLSDASKYMTGANLIVDGGWTAW